MKKVSIIIPAYNVEQYIEGCLSSLLKQDLATADYEIIIVIDGSPDNSKVIAQEFAAQHANILVFEQENQGVSVARNRGLDTATGKYIAFVDPDDSLHPGALSKILQVAENSELDILYLSLESIDETGKLLEHKEKCGTDGVVLDGFTHPRRTFLSTLYRRDIIGSTRFVKGITRGQDTVFNVMVQANAKRCSYCSIPYYKYLKRTDSSRQFVGTEKNFQSCLLAIESINSFKLTYFPLASDLQTKYFDQSILIFIRRTLEWNVLPQAQATNFARLKARLIEQNLQRLICETSNYFPFFKGPFFLFYGWYRLKGYYSAAKYKLNIK
jgi:glycosyltransferase involved in cell wall biosynthesis